MCKIEPYIGKPNKERLLATLRGEKTDRVPNFEVFVEEDHVERLLGRKVGNTAATEGNPAKGSKQAEGTRPMYPENYIELCGITGQDVLTVASIWTPIRQRQPDGTVTMLNDRSFKSRADLERVVWPGESDIEECLAYIREYVTAVKSTDLGVVFVGGAIWQTLYEFVIGMHDCMIMMLDEPELFEELMSRSADYFSELFRRAIQEGVDIVLLTDDFAYNNGLFVAPELFERLWRPHFDRLMAPARDANIPIMFHSDGKIDAAMETLLEMGVCSINPLDPSGVDYRDFKKRYGHRITLHGNIDLTWPLITGTVDDVDKDVKEHMDVLKPGGRWIAASSHSIVNWMPHENYVAMINAIHKYGKY